jgi:hypothetical protein
MKQAKPHAKGGADTPSPQRHDLLGKTNSIFFALAVLPFCKNILNHKS